MPRPNELHWQYPHCKKHPAPVVTTAAGRLLDALAEAPDRRDLRSCSSSVWAGWFGKGTKLVAVVQSGQANIFMSL
jgi:hypothetical protein